MNPEFEMSSKSPTVSELVLRWEIYTVKSRIFCFMMHNPRPGSHGPCSYTTAKDFGDISHLKAT